MKEKLSLLNNDVIHNNIIIELYEITDVAVLRYHGTQIKHYFEELCYNPNDTKHVIRTRRLLDFVNSRIASLKIDYIKLN